MEYLLRLAQVHETFRRPELEALASLHGLDVQFSSYSNDSPYCIVRLQNEDAARALVARSILTDAIYELWGVGHDYESVHRDVHSRTEKFWSKYLHDSFRFSVHGFQGKRSKSKQKQIIESFSYLGFLGPILMVGAQHGFYVHEEFELKAEEPKRIFLGRFIANGARTLVAKYDLKKRNYISTTSMDSELALITANMALAAPGKICYDPFVGTGSFPIACAHFGAGTIGSDIDGRSIRGTLEKNVKSNFSQYSLDSLWLGSFISDLTNTPLRFSRFLNAIVCDPPYGVREGLKVLGQKNGTPKEALMLNGVEAYKLPGYIPPKKAYGFEAILDDILDFAGTTLVDHGRLAMWMPTANDEDIEHAIPTHPSLKLLSVSVQDFNKWSRRLLTYSRLTEAEIDPAAVRKRKALRVGKDADSLNSFRKKYFEGFKERQDQPTNS